MKRERRSKRTSGATFHEGSGNVFRDLGFANPDVELAKAEITIRIIAEISARRLTQARAAALLGVSQADVSDLVRGKLKGYSFERLFRFVNALGLDVGVVIRKLHAANKRGSIEVENEMAEYPVVSRPHGRAGMVAEPFAQASGLIDVLRFSLEPIVDGISAAFVFGSIAKGTDRSTSDVDILVVSESLAYSEVCSAVEVASERLGRRVAPTVYSKMELRERLKRGNAFVTRVLAQPKIWLIGDEDALGG